MTGEDVEHLLAVGFAAAGLDDVAEHDLLTRIVQPRIEGEAAALARLVDRPAGEGARDFGDVLLRVAAVHAERVQLHQLAAVVLVQSLWRILVLRLRALHGGRLTAAAKSAKAARPRGRIIAVSRCGPFGSALIQLSR